MDTLNYTQIQQLPSVDVHLLMYNFISNYMFTPKILYIMFSIFFIMETIKYFSEGTQYTFEINRKVYGIATFIILIFLDYLFNGLWENFKQFLTELILIISPIFVLYNIAFKQFGEYLRRKFAFLNQDNVKPIT